MGEKTLVIDPEKCTGCRKCEIVCSVFHTDTVDPYRSRIKVVKWEGVGSYLPMACQNCEKPYCVKVCPAQACHLDVETHKVLIDRDKCIGCKSCVIACPFGHPFFDVIDRVTVKCDFCQGNPQCVACCEVKAIVYIDDGRAGSDRRTEFASKYNLLRGNVERR